MANSKDVFEGIMDDFDNFKDRAETWCELEDIASAGQARNYAKKIMKNMRLFVQFSVEEEAAVKLALVKEEEAEVVEEVEEKEEYDNPYPEAY